MEVGNDCAKTRLEILQEILQLSRLRRNEVKVDSIRGDESKGERHKDNARALLCLRFHLHQRQMAARVWVRSVQERCLTRT